MKITIAEGQYTPTDFFEENRTVPCTDSIVVFSNGNVTVTFNNGINPSIEKANQINSEIMAIFKIESLLNSNLFIFNGIVLIHKENGKGDVIEVGFNSEVTLGYSNEVEHLDSNGKILYNSKLDKSNYKKAKFNLLTKHSSNHLLRKLLDSNYNANKDSKNLFIHLYEIRDALSKHFGNDINAREKLGITKANWSYFGKLANNEPLNEGRHRGENVTLRNATEEEKQEVCLIAKDMVIKYAEYLDGNP